MTDQPQPPLPDFPPQPQQQPELPTTVETASAPAPAEKKRPGNKVIIGAAAAIIAVIVGTGVVVVQAVNDGDDKPAAAATKSSAPAEDPATTVADEPEPDPEPTFTTPTADDFTIELRTTSRQCFGSAGCNITVEPQLSYTGFSDDLDPDAVYQITYEIKGDDSGPILKTAELSDQTTLNYTPTSLSTKSSGTKLSVKITDIIETGV
uniref:Uncharacterized protein n=1 Tax=Streptomyces violaceoruber TaxID=1935 RepID=Q849D3_STRVN|nr:hypothetical protein [Streptomyces violaceoruber]AAO50191.1 hypothetical protein [Streptomyces violaceoruber]